MGRERQKDLDSDILVKQLPEEFEQKDVVRILSRSARTAQRYIKRLLDRQLIMIKQDAGNQVIYQKIELRFSAYQQSFLDNYIPQKTFFLTSAERKFLHQASKIDASIDLETYSIKIYERLIIDIAWASSRLEGNTYSLIETERLILNHQPAMGKNNLETQMILNHKEAIKFLILNRNKLTTTPLVLKSIHALLSENILSDPSAMGALRKIPVGITGTTYVPLAVPQILVEEFETFLKKASLILDPFEQALFILIFIPYLQPFEDLNKRTSRIACNIPLIKNSMIPISFKNIETNEYVSALKSIYEKNDILEIKKLFIKALQYSVEDYSKLKSILVSPSTAVIKYRKDIKEIIKYCVLHKKMPTLSLLKHVDQADKDEVLTHIKNELKSLHEGSLVRFDLSPSQFLRWKQKSK